MHYYFGGICGWVLLYISFSWSTTNNLVYWVLICCFFVKILLDANCFDHQKGKRLYTMRECKKNLVINKMKIKAGKMIQRLFWVESRPLQVKNMVVLLFQPQNFLFKYENHFGEIITIIDAVSFAWAVVHMRMILWLMMRRGRERNIYFTIKKRETKRKCVDKKNACRV